MSEQLITFEEIQMLPIEDILKFVGVSFTKKGDVLELFEGQSKTDGWRASTTKNQVTDFSEKGRASGGPYSFVKKYHNLEDKDVFTFFVQYKHGIKNFERVLVESIDRKFENEKDAIKRKEIVNSIVDIYKSLDSDTNKLVKYLKGRSIDYYKLPDGLKKELKAGSINFDSVYYNEKLFIPMKDVIKSVDENGNELLKSEIVGVKARAIDSKINPDFKSISIKNSFIGMLFDESLLSVDKGNNIFLCEGETDALSLYSTGVKYVVGNLGGVGFWNKNINNIFDKFENIIIAYDDDIAGKRGIVKVMENIGGLRNFYDIDFGQVRKGIVEHNPSVKQEEIASKKLDINDILKYCNGDKNIFHKVLKSSIKKVDPKKLLKTIEENKDSKKISSFNGK